MKSITFRMKIVILLMHARKQFIKRNRETLIGSLYSWLLVPWSFKFEFQVLCEVKTSVQRLSFNIFCCSLIWTCNNFRLSTFLEKSFDLVSPTHFIYDYSSKIFPCLYWQKFIHSFIYSFILCLLSLLEILVKICILIIFSPVDDVINFKINLNFFVKLFFYMMKKVRTKTWNKLINVK